MNHSTRNKIRTLLLLLITAGMLFVLSGCQKPLDTIFTKDSLTEFGETLNQKIQDLYALTEKYLPSEKEEYSLEAIPDVYTVLLIGSDRRDTTWWGNSDCMMLLSVNKSKKTISLISLLRDMGVYINGNYNKFNASLALGGPDLVVNTVQENFEVAVNAYIYCDFTGIIDIVDLFGGVTLDVSDDEVEVMNMYMEELSKLYNFTISDYTLPCGGHYTLNGMRTLAYCRNRYSSAGGDFDRTARQRAVLNILYEKMKCMSLTELANMAAQILPLVQTNISSDALSALIPALTQEGYTVVMDRIPYDGLYTYGSENIDPIWPDTISRLRATLYD